MALTRIPSSGLEGNITLGNVVISGSITNSLGQTYTAGTGAGGYTGSAGTNGAVGYTGSAGVNGYTGSVGYTGSAGSAGSAGSDGYTGSAGSAGSDGYTGSNGYTGSQGATGSVGFTGSQGNTGLGFAIAKSYTSVAALTADTAPTGIVAGQFAIIETGSVDDADNSKLYLWSGTAYSYVTDLSGAAGITGPAGSVGFTGSAGEGFAGSTGYTGSAGIGFTGSAGAGYTGSAGANGNNGSTGAQGPIGYTGSAGTGGGGGGSIGYTGSAGTTAIQEFIATEGQDTFAVSGGYTAGSVLVFVNGIQMNNNDYTAANEVSVVLAESRRAGDVVRVIFSIVSPSININDIKTFSIAMSIALGL